MKKIILTVAAVFAFGLANAQEKDAKAFGFSKGDLFVEGSLSLASENDKNTEVKTNATLFTPKAGYFVSDNFAIGLELSMFSFKEKTAGTETDKESMTGASVFGRYYFLNLGERFKTYTEFGFGIGTGKSGSGLAETKTKMFGAGLDLGVNYFVTPKFAVNFGLANVLSYNSEKLDGGEAITTTTADLNVFNNFFSTPTFGMTYKF